MKKQSGGIMPGKSPTKLSSRVAVGSPSSVRPSMGSGNSVGMGMKKPVQPPKQLAQKTSPVTKPNAGGVLGKLKGY